MVEIISRDILKEKIDNKDQFILVDVRDTPDYEAEHIIGAVHLLISEMEKKVNLMFKKNDLIITYSKDTNCPASGIAANTLIKYGFPKVLRYKDGWKDWKEAGYPVE